MVSFAVDVMSSEQFAGSVVLESTYIGRKGAVLHG